MTPQERDLIQSVFDRLAAQHGAKDSEAEKLIQARAAAQPNALYGLVEAVVMLEAGLNQAQSRINELQRQLEQQPSNQAPAGSFLGAAAASPWAGASVPRSGAQPVYSAPQPAPQPVYYAAQPMAPAMAPSLAPSPWAQPAGGSFLRNAATMAAGVAGGTLIAEGLSSMFGGHHYGGGFGDSYGGGFGGGYGGPAEVVENVTVNNYYDNQAGGGGSFRDESGLQQASYDVDDGGGFDDSADI